MRKKRKLHLTRHALLIFVVLASSFVLYWSVVVASWDNSVVGEIPPKLIPGPHLIENIKRVFTESMMGKGLLNSFIVSGTVTLSVLLNSTLAGFVFAKLKFPGRDKLFGLMLATMMIPSVMGIVPLYITMVHFGWTGQLQAVIAPSLASAFGTFWVRNYLNDALPDGLLEAGRVDGCSTLRLYWHVALPTCRPVAAMLGVFTFIGTWKDLFWPLVVLNPGNPTAQTALTTLAGGRTMDFSLVMAGVAVAMFPTIIVFLFAGKWLISGIMEGAVKG